MARTIYIRERLGDEVQAPSGYYRPLAEGWLAHQGGHVLYVLGSACIEASCCGVGSWSYVRVEGRAVGEEAAERLDREGRLEIDTIDAVTDRRSITALLRQHYPEARVEFR